MLRSRVSVSLPLPFTLATAADNSAATTPEQLLRIEWHNSTNLLNYKRLNRVNLPRRSEVRQRQNNLWFQCHKSKLDFLKHQTWGTGVTELMRDASFNLRPRDPRQRPRSLKIDFEGKTKPRGPTYPWRLHLIYTFWTVIYRNKM